MTKKRATTNRTEAAPKQASTNKISLFLETTAQFYRLTGAPSLREPIEELRRGSEKVGTSAHVKREFDYVYGGFFNSVMFNVRRLPGQASQRKFSDIWMDVENLMRRHYPGGHTVFTFIGLTLFETLFEIFGSKLVSPTRVLNELGGLRDRLLGGFCWGDKECFFDNSTCGVWNRPTSCDCGSVPADACRLKEICIMGRSDFLDSAETLANKGREESKWLRDNLGILKAAQGKALMELIGKHPGHVGDPVIFWEAPDGWTILTRDSTFRILQKAHRNEIKVYFVRLQREASGGKCTVLPEATTQVVEGVLMDYNAQGARVRAPAGSVKKRQRVTITAREFGNNGGGADSREGRVVYFDKEDTSVFAVRFPAK